jgi:hypothetical protein
MAIDFLSQARPAMVSALLTPSAFESGFDCSYRNASDRMVILRCLGPQNFFLERVVFPFEPMSFHCPPGSEVEIWTHSLGGPELVERLDAAALSGCCA